MYRVEIIDYRIKIIGYIIEIVGYRIKILHYIYYKKNYSTSRGDSPVPSQTTWG